MYCHHPNFFFPPLSLSPNCGGHNSWSGRCSPIFGFPYAVHDLFFRFGGARPLHTIQFQIRRNPLHIPTTCFAIFPLKTSYRVFLSVPSLSKCYRCPGLHPLMSIAVPFTFLRHSSHLTPRSFIRLLPRSCCFRPRFLMPFLHSGPFQRLFSSVRPFRVLGEMTFFPCLWSPCSLCRVTFAQPQYLDVRNTLLDDTHHMDSKVHCIELSLYVSPWEFGWRTKIPRSTGWKSLYNKVINWTTSAGDLYPRRCLTIILHSCSMSQRGATCLVLLILLHIVTCRGDYRRGFGLDVWISWQLIHSIRNYRQYSAIADLHTLQLTVAHALGFSVFSIRIPPKDL
jgi:hypothetical protein